ncbi:16S rRNA (cytidine(1402)-2'-O)-methyltransferase [Persephonella sp.]
MGTLYIVGTPIGNLKDITYRAVEILNSVEIIACEDTRVTKKLLDHYSIYGKKLIPYHEHIEEEASDRIVQILKEGKDVALVSDAGTPCISDPGYRVVKKAWEQDIKVVPVPGAFAGAVALSASGLPSDKFLFVGFLSNKEKKKREELEHYKRLGYTFIVYESPNRLLKTLSLYREILPESDLVIAKELTKIYETFVRGKTGEVYNFFEQNPEIIKGEFVIICHPEEKEEFNQEEIIEKAKKLKEKGFKIREISKLLSKETGQPKNQIYKLLLNNL